MKQSKTLETMTQMTHEEIVSAITSFVNSTDQVHRSFIAAMNAEHRTLQQSFTKLCLQWLEYVASDDYRYDDRNRASHEIAKVLMDAFAASKVSTNPSDYLPLI